MAIDGYPTLNTSSYVSFRETVNVVCSGDIRTLIDWENYSTVSTNEARFVNLFHKCSVLTSAPKLPSTELATYCYFRMFNFCTALEIAPVLPAETLAKSCYWEMFNFCTALEIAPALPAETLAESCYFEMFKGCTALEIAPVLPAETLAEKCYISMFQNCSNLSEVTVKAKKTTVNLSNLSKDYFYCWLSGVATSGKIHKRSTLNLRENNHSGIPTNWTAVDDVTD